jgi:prepilin-type N-terminal cleavage/methylation domain-containing protein/prepilin-type processing-associated H-X9-DG protein
MKSSVSLRRRTLAFTLVELLVVMAIIALLAGLSLPGSQNAINKARSIKCAGNLHQIGIAASQAATDNNNRYPEIDQAGAPIYTPPGPNLVTALGPYGVNTNPVQCPVDLATAPSSFTTYGSSYEWDPVFDDEPPNQPVVYITPTVAIPVNSSRVRLAMDFAGIHGPLNATGIRRPNVLYGDGHVATH